MARKLRDYEVSIWTLQDEFITVLKPSHLEHKGQLIGKDNLNIKDDGTRSVSFSIPMYIYQGAERKENPIWHTTKDGTIVIDMRKIKVIFNKDDSGQDGIAEKDNVFEFIITDVVERHEQDQLYCDITCDGLAFHELGKVGYKISLSSEEFYNNDYDWFTNGSWTDANGVAHSEQPIANLQYWVNQFLEPVPETIVDRTQWYYEVRMNWKSYADGTTRDSDKVYEEEYAASWIEQNGLLVPGSTVHSAEKTRMVELEESNKYNLTQDIAKTFEVFCRYQYLYDDNYHIIGRKVIFYNSYMIEDTGYLDLTYPYSTSAITRERDSKDLTTKMFVRPVDNDASASGMITIMETEANKSREDYLLNFDYLHSIGAVTDEQYDEISLYETHMAQCNRQLEQLSVALSVLQDKKIELEAAIKTAEDSIPLDLERIEAASQLYNNLVKLHGDDEGRGIAITADSPHTAIPLRDSNAADGSYYITFNIMGILPGTVNIYTTYNSVNKSLSGALSKTWRNEFDDEGNLVAIRKLPAPASSASYYYLTFTYSPKLYYDKVIQTWQKRLGEDKHIKETSDAELIEVNNNIDIFQAQYNNWLTRKKKYVKDFEKMMGPALRESYWQPEDYLDYGDMYNESLTMPTLNITSSTIADNELSSIIWDSNLFDNEQEGTYEYSVTQTVKSYPYIVVDSDILALLADNANSLENLCYYYYDYPASNPVRDITSLKMYPLTSLCTFSFITRNTNVVQPVILLTGYSGQRSSLMKAENNYGIGRYDLSTNTLTSLLTGFTVAANDNHTEVKAYYPRIKISSLNLKISSDQLVVKYNGEELTNYEDYYIVARDDSTVDNGTINTDTAYYITIKPIVYYKAGTFNGTVDIKYSISNADVSIYLDAIKVLKENSMPKVSYTIDLSALDDEFIYKAYNKLSQIANINDTDLKFENMQGYISELQLNLDKPWEDKIIIKNYKTKFEDLFSTIVAQTEEMRKNAFAIERAGEVLTQDGITPEALESTLLNPRSINIMDAYLNAGFDDYSVVEEVLKNAFDQAGEIIAAANSTLGSLRGLNIENASILAGFAENVAAALTPTVYTSSTRPTTFKTGDVWITTDEEGHEYRYISTTGSDLVANDTESNTAGWTRTYDGSLASITGANLVIDAQAGTIDLLAENEINIKSGSDLYIAANDDVAIVGNKSVNIGGPQIKIAADGEGHVGGIHLVTSAYDAATPSTSKIDITGEGITMAAGNGIELLSGAAINIKSSDASSTSVISIDKTKGIYLGANNGIKLYSGAVGVGNTSVDIQPTHLLFGVEGTASASAAEFTPDQIIIANGSSISSLTTGKITANGSTQGVVIQKDFIGFATGTTTSRKAIILDSGSTDAITISSGIITPSRHLGTYVRISSSGIDLGASGNLYINTANVQLQTEGDGIGGTTRFALGANLNTSSPDPKLFFDSSGNLSITGTLIATSLKIGADGTHTISSEADLTNYINEAVGDMPEAGSQIHNGKPAAGAFKVLDMYRDTQTGISYIATSDTGAGTWVQVNAGNINGASLEVDAATGTAEIKANKTLALTTNGKLSIAGGQGVEIGSGSNLTIASGGKFIITSTNFNIDSSGNVQVQGVINATSGTIGNWTLTGSRLYSTSNQSGTDKYLVLNSASNATNALWIGNDSYQSVSGEHVPPFRVTYNGTLYATDAHITGEITATSGQIGSWVLNDNYLESSDHTLGFDARSTVTNAIWVGGDGSTRATAPFRVTRAGVLTATDANITGAITATSLSLGSNVSIPYTKISGSPDLTIYISKDGTIGSTPAAGSTGFTVSSAGLLQASNAIIYGTLYSSAGTIGGWSLTGGRLYSGSGTSYVGLSADVTGTSPSTRTAIWAGAETASQAPFRVLHNGEVTASKLTIKQASSESNTQGIGIVSVPVYGDGTTTQGSQSNTQYYLWAGKETPGASNFRVTKDGTVYVNNIYIKNSTDTGNINLTTKLQQLGNGYTITGFSAGTDGYTTQIVLNGGNTTLNFKRAAIDTTWLTTGLVAGSTQSITAYALAHNPSTSDTSGDVRVTNPLAGTVSAGSISLDNSNTLSCTANVYNSDSTVVATHTRTAALSLVNNGWTGSSATASYKVGSTTGNDAIACTVGNNANNASGSTEIGSLTTINLNTSNTDQYINICFKVQFGSESKVFHKQVRARWSGGVTPD